MSARDLSRRDFVKTTGAAGAGLVIGFHVPVFQGCAGPQAVPVEGGAEPNGWIRVDPDDTLSLVSPMNMG